MQSLTPLGRKVAKAGLVGAIALVTAYTGSVIANDYNETKKVAYDTSISLTATPTIKPTATIVPTASPSATPRVKQKPVVTPTIFVSPTRSR